MKYGDLVRKWNKKDRKDRFKKIIQKSLSFLFTFLRK